MKCALYPCFDITAGKLERKENAEWRCGKCERRETTKTHRTQSILEKFSEKTGVAKKIFRQSDRKAAFSAIRKLRKLEGLEKGFAVLSGAEKQAALEIEKKTRLSNIGVFSCLLRDVTVAFSHNSKFRPPGLPEVLLAGNGEIIGEQNNAGIRLYLKKRHDETVLPAIPFPEISGKNVCSGSPSPALDKRLREKMRVKEGDATLLLGFDLQ